MFNKDGRPLFRARPLIPLFVFAAWHLLTAPSNGTHFRWMDLDGVRRRMLAIQPDFKRDLTRGVYRDLKHSLNGPAAVRAGFDDVRVYYLSFGDWVRDESCPVVRD